MSRTSVRPQNWTPDEARPGLRERKKRETRERISRTATAMFLAEGFDRVRVADVATACQVSEKTVYNYFPTKESLVFDRESEMIDTISEALGAEKPFTTPVDAMLYVISAELDRLVAASSATRDSDVRSVSQFLTMVENSSPLRAAQRDLIDRTVEAVAVALADRMHRDHLEPEPRAAAHALVGIWEVTVAALRREARLGHDGPRTRAAVFAETLRAASVIKSGLAGYALPPAHL